MSTASPTRWPAGASLKHFAWLWQLQSNNFVRIPLVTSHRSHMSSPSSSDFRLRLTPEQQQAIKRLAARSRVSAEQAIMQAVEQALANANAASSFPEGTPMHGMDDTLSALGEGPADLSTNPEYLDGLGS